MVTHPGIPALIPILSLLFALPAAADDPTGRILLAGEGPEIAVVTCPRGSAPITFRRMASAAWSIGESKLAPRMLAMGAGRGLIVWSGPSGAVFARFRLDGETYREIHVGRWPTEWSAADAADLDGDGIVDLLLTRYDGEGDAKRYHYRVAPGTVEGGFAFEELPPIEVVAKCRGAFFVLGDVNQDGNPDLLFHGYPHGGRYQTHVMMLPGDGTGRFAEVKSARTVLTSPHGATRPILADLVGGGNLDLFLPPDDDVADNGQCHVALNRGDGTFSDTRPSFDLLPSLEGSASDEFYGAVAACDLDGDGQADLVAQSLRLQGSRYDYEVYWGLGDGAFEQIFRPVAVDRWARHPISCFLPLRRAGGEGTLPPEEPIAEFKPVWDDLGSEDLDRACAAMTRCLRSGGGFVGPARTFLIQGEGPVEPTTRIKRALAVLETIGGEDARRLIEEVGAHAAGEEVAGRVRTALERLPAKPDNK